MRYSVRVPADSVRTPQYMEQAFAAIHALLPRWGALLTLEFVGQNGEVTLAYTVPNCMARVVPQQIYAYYPDVRIDPMAPEPPLRPEERSWSLDLHLGRDLFPLKRFSQFEDPVNRTTADPLSGLLSLLAAEKGHDLRARLVLTVCAVPPHILRRTRRCLHRLSSPFFLAYHYLAHLYGSWATSPYLAKRIAGWILGRLGRAHNNAPALTTSPNLHHEREADLQAAADKLGRPIFRSHLRLTVTGPAHREEEALATLSDLAAAFGQFHLPRLSTFHAYRARRWPLWFLLSAEELATLWHPAMITVAAPTLTQVDSREREPPLHLPTPLTHPALAVLGMTAFRNRRERFGILPQDRRRHMSIVGKTGMGKTTLLQYLISCDIRAGRGVALLDPHGDLCEALLAGIPRARTNEVILFDAADTTHPLSFNILHCPRWRERPLVASGILSAFKKLYADFWGPRMEHILRNALLALLETPGSTLLTLLRLLTDVRFRQALVRNLQDPVVRVFWQEEFAALPIKFQLEAVAPIQNKIGHFVSSPLLRNILGQTRNSLDLRTVLDEGKVLLVNLAKGRLGDDVSSLLGSFLVTAVQLAAMSRADVSEAERSDYFLYVDEFQNFATESFATILSEARKYGLALTLANQYLAQLDESTADAVFGNVGTLVAFQVGPDDAEVLATQFAGDLLPQDLLRLPRYQAYIRLLINGNPSRPFSMTTLPPSRAVAPERRAIIRRTSRHRYSRPAAEVEAEIRKAVACS